MPDIFNPVETAQEVIRSLLEKFASDFITAGMKMMSQYIADPADFDKIPHFKELLFGSQSAATSLVIILLYLRISNSMRDLVTDEDSPNYAAIMADSAIALAMIWSFPAFMNKIMLPIVNEIVKWIGSFKIDVNSAGKILDSISPTGGLETAALHILFMAALYGVGTLILAIAGIFRFTQLVVAMICGPVFLATYANKSGTFKSFLTSLSAIIFTQIIHMLCFALVVWTAAKGSFEGLLISFCFMIIGAAGPFILKQWMFGSGISGMAAGGLRMVVNRAMFRGIGK
ncbi:hypothetical protein IAE23_29310 [Bacillus sp. S35]|nr:hypothetical protein [Bacillus sp. S35]